MTLPEVVDSHVHLDFDSFDADRPDTILRARESGVRYLLNIGTNLATSRFSVELAANESAIYAAVGIHPHDATEVNPENLAELKRLFQQPKAVAIGEIGLDYFKMYQPIPIQERAFRQQLELALELHAPVIIHTRAADDETIALIKQVQSENWNGVFHCFPGDLQMADQVLELGFHISFTGSITFNNFKGLHVVRHIPLERLLLETDCPFMTPVPHRGKRNEPAFVHFVGQKVAQIKEISFAEVARQTTENFRRLLQIQENL